MSERTRKELLNIEIYYLDADGNPQDALIHDQILAEGDEEEADRISRESMLQLGFTQEEVDRFYAIGREEYWRERMIQNGWVVRRRGDKYGVFRIANSHQVALDVSDNPELQNLPAGEYTEEEFQQMLAERADARE